MTQDSELKTKMFSLKPFQLSATFICPDCKCKFGQPESLTFMGTHVLADCVCECCENKYYHTVPTGHAALFPIAFSQKTTKATYDELRGAWLAEPLITSVRENRSVERTISKQVFKEYKDVILLNCLDSCYGHVFLKLLNAQKYIRTYPQKGLIVLIPSNFLWLLPSGIAEVWQVDAKPGDFNNRILNLNAFVKKELDRFDSVLLSNVPVHPDIHAFEMKDFLKTEKFNLAEFASAPAHITFILREDRFWVANKLDAFLLKLCISKGWLKGMKKYFITKQNRLFSALAKEIDKQAKGKIKFSAAGLGKTGKLSGLITDHRKEKIYEKTEIEWCRLYAASHLVIGIHGSNMLIPTALSAGFIELLPRYKIYNFTEDIAMDHKGRYMQFLGRYLDEFTSIKLVAKHAVSMMGLVSNRSKEYGKRVLRFYSILNTKNSLLR